MGRELLQLAGLAEGDGPLRDDSGDGVLVDHLLLAIAGEDHGEGVKAGDIAPHLKPVHQKDGDGAAVPADLGEEDLLKIVGFLPGEHSFFL